MAEKSVSEFLSKLDAWTVYDAEKLLNELHEQTPCGVIDMGIESDEDGNFKHFAINYPNRHEHVNIYPSTAESIINQMQSHPSSGSFDPQESEWFIAGYVLASSLALLVTGRGPTKMGRGFRFQESISMIREVESG